MYLVNQNAKGQLFWAFLSEPEISDSPEVFANSSTSLYIPGGSQDLNAFTIPVQYMIGGGASNNAVGLDTLIISNASRNTALAKCWNVTYGTVPPNQGPIIPSAPSGTSKDGTVSMKTNAFDQQKNMDSHWYENMSFGVKTAQGFMGVSWSPDPNKTYIITPKLVFYIAVGSYSSNTLADITAVSNDSAICDTAKDFDSLNQCTVTYTRTGEWSVVAGRPAQAMLRSNREIMLASLD